MDISENDIRAQLHCILAHPDFAATPQRRAFLSYIVEEYLAGRADQIKGVSIAMSVFDRDETFDQQIDPIVRLEARRLRQDIDGYYAGPGRQDPLRLTIPKGGYAPRFERVAPPEQPGLLPEVAPLEIRNPRRIPAIGLGVAGLLALCALVWFAFVGWWASSPSVSEGALPQGPVVAVLPFDTLGEGPGYFADGLTQQLTSELARFRDIWVLPLGSGQRSSQGGSDLQGLRTEFNADFALEGSVLDKGDTIVLSARLIDLKSQRYVWVNDYSTGRAPSEIYSAQDNIIRDVIGRLAGKYGVLTQDAMKTATRTPPSNRDAYDCVLSYYSYQITIDHGRHPAIMDCIQRSLEQSPDYAEAWAVLSNLYLQQIRFGLGGDRQEVIAAASDAARRAVEIDPNLAAGHLMLANMRFVRGDFDGFRRAGQIAVGLNPNDSSVLAHYGMRLAFSGDWDEGLAIVDRAIALNPVHPHWYHFPRIFYEFDQGNYQQALTVLDQIDMPNFLWTHLWSAVLNASLERQQEAQSSLNELLLQRPAFASEANSILSIWQLGDQFEQKLLGSLHKAGLEIDK
ncbi:TolB amino-terminal domain-containing protein [Ruegeria halocynthiae]|uniref:TolB amino-terminal domain-containing protein n=1 Tax=Ruegeria halocynthiae TaxID=985054 RepID=A0A1H2WAZ4_9RHOB|nr:tetratricopeptide repeat protein [Ruegeria halocynthiae]SDW77695.1 TolB amino-terminal domain-containing protein [Ruegeria halocynthiae]